MDLYARESISLFYNPVSNTDPEIGSLPPPSGGNTTIKHNWYLKYLRSVRVQDTPAGSWSLRIWEELVAWKSTHSEGVSGSPVASFPQKPSPGLHAEDSPSPPRPTLPPCVPKRLLLEGVWITQASKRPFTDPELPRTRLSPFSLWPDPFRSFPEVSYWQEITGNVGLFVSQLQRMGLTAPVVNQRPDSEDKKKTKKTTSPTFPLFIFHQNRRSYHFPLHKR